MSTLEEKIAPEALDNIHEIMINDHAELYHNAFTDDESKMALGILLKELFPKVLDTEAKVQHVVRELVGMGLIEEIRSDERVTDIGFDGNRLWIQGNGFEKYSVPFEIEDADKVVSKFSSSTRKELTAKKDILNTSKDRMRLNAVHKNVAKNGMTFAIRISRPGLALNEENFETFAPLYMLDFIKAVAQTRSNIMISGDTGTGKTEFQKLFINYIRPKERIAFIESNKDMYIKETFPERDIFYWVSNEKTTIEHLISHAALRSHPVWIMVAEVVGREVYQMMNGILTGHKIATTLHSVDARAQPYRLLGMAKEGYNIDENMFLDNFYRYVDWGFHIEKTEVEDGKEIRYLNEVVAFNSDHSATTVFKQEFVGDGFEIETGALPANFIKKLKKFRVNYEGSEFRKEG